MADSRQKGQRGEMQVRDALREATGLQWERVPGSGGYGAQHGLKGDVYLPPATGHISRYAVEVKWYKDEQLNSNILNATNSQLEKWWEQTAREAGEMSAKPMLVFKKDRGTWFACLDYDDVVDNYLDHFENVTNLLFQKNGQILAICDFKQWLAAIELKDIVK